MYFRLKEVRKTRCRFSEVRDPDILVLVVSKICRIDFLHCRGFFIYATCINDQNSTKKFFIKKNLLNRCLLYENSTVLRILSFGIIKNIFNVIQKMQMFLILN